MIYALCLLLIFVGLYGVVVKRNALKIVICLLIMEHGVNLLFILVGYRTKGTPPILSPGTEPAVFAASAVGKDNTNELMKLTKWERGVKVESRTDK